MTKCDNKQIMKLSINITNSMASYNSGRDNIKVFNNCLFFLILFFAKKSNIIWTMQHDMP